MITTSIRNTLSCVLSSVRKNVLIKKGKCSETGMWPCLSYLKSKEILAVGSSASMTFGWLFAQRSFVGSSVLF